MRLSLPVLTTLCVVPFLVNDLYLIFQVEYGTYVAIEMVLRSTVVVVALAVPAGRRALRPLAGRPYRSLQGIGWTVGLTLAIVLAFPLRWYIPGQPWGWAPIADDHLWLLLDTAIGIPLVALSEEIVARGLVKRTLEDRRWHPVLVTLAASLLFGLWHWSGGLGHIAMTAASGVLFMVCVYRTGSLWPAVAAHTLIDLWLISWIDWQELLGVGLPVG